MRPGSLTGLVMAAILALGLLPAAAVADDGPHARPTGPAGGTPPGLSGSTPAAARALAAVEAAFAGRGAGSTPDRHGRLASPTRASTDVTVLLLELRRRLSGLSDEDRRTAGGYFARPTEGNDEPYRANYGDRARPTSDCAQAPRRTPRFCVHWARRTRHAPPSGDRDRDGIPNQVERTRAVVARVWNREVRRGGYRAPLKDGDRGGSRKLDIYLADIGDAGVYGYCAPERQVSGNAHTVYCVLDDDFSREEFPGNSPLANLQVTTAHEFFHAVQFAYDAFEDPWFVESTATWIEDEIFDRVNDNRFYLRDSPLSRPARPLDLDDLPFGGLSVYGSWIWWRYLTERFPGTRGTGLPVLVRKVWQAADSTDRSRSDLYSLKALEKVLANRGQRLSQLYGDFATANRRPGAAYEEGSAYRSAPVSLGPFDMTADRAKVRAVPTLDHLSSQTAAFRPRGATTRLRLDVDVPDAGHEPVVHARVFRTNGTARVTQLRLSSTGEGTVTVPFDKGTVRRVELVLSNGGHAYTCWRSTFWSCAGRPRDDNLDFEFTATRLRS